MRLSNLIVLSNVLLLIACTNSPKPENTIGEEKEVVPPPPPIDSVAKADSILKLKYDKTTYQVTLKELARWDSCAAHQVDSGVVYLTKKIKGMWKAKSAVAQMDTIPYKGLLAHAKKFYRTTDNSRSTYFKGEEHGVQMVVFKPVIYLYPTEETAVIVNLGFVGTDLYTWPKVDGKQNWSVTAQPDGMLTAAGEEYPYLFWEGKMNDYSWINTNEGFLIEGNKVEDFFVEKLKVLGLNARERTDFITFWAPKLYQNKYNLIRFETTQYTKALPLSINPAPESIQRILMVYKPLDAPLIIKQQELKPFTRKGYTVIEWGGMEMPGIIN